MEGRRGGGGLMLYLNEKIPCKFSNNHPIVPNAEIICIKFHQLKRIWLPLGCYKSPTQSDLEFIASITKIDGFYLQKFENLFIISDLNVTTENTHLNVQIYDLTVLIQEATCYQLQNPNCIDHFLTNRKTLFKHCQTFETVLSDNHKLILTIMKSGIFKGPPERKIIEGDIYGEFEKEFTNVLSTHAPITQD